MSYPNNMSYKGIVDWATSTSVQNDINATKLGQKTLSEVKDYVLDNVISVTPTTFDAILALLN